MHLPPSLLALFLLLPLPGALSATPARRHYATHDYYVLEHDPSASTSLHDCAHALGVDVVEQVGSLRDHWLVRVQKPLEGVLKRLEAQERDVILDRFAALRKRAKKRSRAALGRRSAEAVEARRIVDSVRSLERQHLRQRTKRVPPSFERAPQLRPEINVTSAEQVAEYLHIADPDFPLQWHLNNKQNPFNTVNVTAVWDMGFTGKGVRVAVIDDGLDLNSDDLAANFNAQGSWDFNDHVPEPLPRLGDDRHGTRCAGEIAAVRNDVCGVGVAYDAQISGIRILSGPISDADEAASLNYGYEDTAVYSCSWGPPDDGRSMEAPQDLIQKAILNGVQKGRGGKGSIFVFASGNGAGAGDQCNFDGYTNSIFSVTVGAIDSYGLHPYYSESCAANMVVAYSSGSGDSIHTTDVGKRSCTNGHGGTSAAAPLVAGVIALAIEVRPDLTWRDVQHLCVNTAFQINPSDPDWEMTAAGRHFSYKYGYGAIDGYSLVTAARTWPLVKPQAWIDVGEVDMPGADMDWEGHMMGGTFIGPDGVSSQMDVTAEMLAENNFEVTEHVTVRVWVDHTKRGDIEVRLTSPNNVVSVLAGKRPQDGDRTGLRGWQFSSVKHWGENPIGAWTLHVSDQQNDGHNGSFLGWSMTIWGSSIDPSKATLWQLPSSGGPPAEDEEDDGELDDESSSSGLPPSTTDPAASASRTKVISKPTDHLPDNHTDATGEAHLPAFSKKPTATDSAVMPLPTSDDNIEDVPGPESTPSSIPDALDGGYFDHMRDLLSNQYWLFGAFGAVVLFMIGAGVYYWRRSIRRRIGAAYATVAAEDMPMSAMERGGRMGANGDSGRTKELYDAFAHASEEDEDELDEHAALTNGHERSVGLAYHDGFLDDEDQTPAKPEPLYTDDPTDEEKEGGRDESRERRGDDDERGLGII